MSIFDHNSGFTRRSAPQTEAILHITDPRMINGLLLFGVFMFFIAYIFFNNAASTKGFFIRSLEKKIITLENQQQKLSLEVVAGQSMDTVETKISGLGFVPVSRIDYVNAGGGAVAVR